MQAPNLKIYNSYTREKSLFEPLNAPHVGMYVCGPTVYNDVHLGNCRTFVSFDVIFRYLKYLGYKVRYVRNITDVGHLEGDADCAAESKIDQRARLEQLEPMEIVQKYTYGFHQVMDLLGNLPPSIEPTATGHILEQIEMVKQILDNGYGYERNGSVYFDVEKLLNNRSEYGKLSGKKQEDLLVESRDNLKNQGEKNHPSDFAIWVKAAPTHLMRWNSPWGVGFPGWHLECSAMSTKYLGKEFDIHGGGMDLQFPHHENEIAQNIGACGCAPVRYWMHGNMLLLNGRKMSKSEGNYVLPHDLFHHSEQSQRCELTKAYSPMTLRFFFLQAHYRSTLNLTDAGLQSAEKGYQRLFQAWETLQKLGAAQGQEASAEDQFILAQLQAALEAMNDDFNTAEAIAALFQIVPKINSLADGKIALSQVQASTLSQLRQVWESLLFDVFGLRQEEAEEQTGVVGDLMDLILDLRKEARGRKDWASSDKIRDHLAKANIQVKDSKDGQSTWEIKS